MRAEIADKLPDPPPRLPGDRRRSVRTILRRPMNGLRRARHAIVEDARDFASLRIGARIYIVLLVAAGAAATVAALAYPLRHEPNVALFIYFGFALVTALFVVKIPYTNVHFSVDTAFVFSILILFGLWPALIADMTGKLLLSLRGGKTGRLFKAPFNMASGGLAVFAAFLAFDQILPLAARLESSGYVVPILVMVGVYYIVNTASVAAGICFVTGDRYIPFWVKNFLPTGVGFLASGSIATLIIILDRAGGPLGFMVTIPFVGLVWFTQKMYLRKEEDARAYINGLESINRQLQTEIDERRRAEADRDRFEKQLLQAQKMEAMGRLAGGVAHDFNNLLTGILGYATMARDAFDDEHVGRGYATEVMKAANRAANLTRQLLAFSRRQEIQPRVLNFNSIIADAHKMLARIIGEDVAIDISPSDDLANVKADPGQIEQVLVNLLVNARDAMPGGGAVRVCTFNATLDEEYLRHHLGVAAGDYVVIEVADTGTGMDEETRKRIFEPFFTTKPVGKGTGLGLSTVYGIVQQNRGHIEVESAPGVGTTFRIYFPRAGSEIEERMEMASLSGLPGGTETILVVEDEDALRKLECLILTQRGYRVIEASNGQEALNLLRARKNDIDMILSDVVMPHMNGKELAARARMVRPGLPVVLMTGYTKDTIETYGITEGEIPVVAKPFTNEQLTHAVRNALDEAKAESDVA
ncbi:MAG: response regulator [Deltaproteobacteria bacterium]|nr:response regulator [Deltaproteobacteria bacterium]